MVTIPTVKSFLGFVDLKIACIANAAFRLLASIIILLLLFALYVFVEDEMDNANEMLAVLPQEEKVVQNAEEDINEGKFTVALYSIITAIILAINIVASYWFITGAKSVRHYYFTIKLNEGKIKINFIFSQGNPSKMKYYLMAEVAVIFMFLLLLIYHVGSIVAVVIECYTLLLSYSLYQEFLMGGYLHGDAVNTTENTAIKYNNVQSQPGLYDSFEQNTQQTQFQHTNANPFKE